MELAMPPLASLRLTPGTLGVRARPPVPWGNSLVACSLSCLLCTVLTDSLVRTEAKLSLQSSLSMSMRPVSGGATTMGTRSANSGDGPDNDGGISGSKKGLLSILFFSSNLICIELAHAPAARPRSARSHVSECDLGGGGEVSEGGAYIRVPGSTAYGRVPQGGPSPCGSSNCPLARPCLLNPCGPIRDCECVIGSDGSYLHPLADAFLWNSS